MHLPPSAQWRLGRSSAHGFLLMLAEAINFFLLFFLQGQTAHSTWWGLLALASALLLHAGLRWWKSPVGVLRWTGREWHWVQAGAVQVGALRWVLDLQTVALVHVGPASGRGASRWLWLERGVQSPAAWTALRRALVASVSEAGRAGDEALAASGATNFSVNYLTGLQMPHLPPSVTTVALNAGTTGFQDSTLR